MPTANVKWAGEDAGAVDDGEIKGLEFRWASRVALAQVIRTTG